MSDCSKGYKAQVDLLLKNRGNEGGGRRSGLIDILHSVPAVRSCFEASWLRYRAPDAPVAGQR